LKKKKIKIDFYPELEFVPGKPYFLGTRKLATVSRLERLINEGLKQQKLDGNYNENIEKSNTEDS
jgi:hypothetical protein